MADAMDTHGDGLIPTAHVLDFLREEAGLTLRTNGDQGFRQVRRKNHVRSIPVHSLERHPLCSTSFMCNPSEDPRWMVLFLDQVMRSWGKRYEPRAPVGRRRGSQRI